MSDFEGKPAPNFSLEGSDGKTHGLSDYAGKYVVLYFYPKDDTPGCTIEACNFRDRMDTLASQNVTVLGVSPDDAASHHKFIDKYDLNFVLLSDPEQEALNAYGAWGEKNMYGKKYMGVIRSTAVIGPDATVLKYWTKIRDAEKHVNEVSEFLAEQSG